MHWGCLWLSSSVTRWGNAWELPKAQAGLFPFYWQNHHIWLPHPCQTWLTLRTHKSISEEVLSLKCIRCINEKSFLFFFLFKCCKETVSHETAEPSNFNSICCSNLTSWTRLWYQYVILGNMAQSTDGTKKCFPTAAGKSTYFGILTAREHMISNCFFQKN